MRLRTILLLAAIILFFCLSRANADIYLNDGSVHNISSQFPHGDVYIDYQKPGMGTTVNLLSGGIISGNPVRAYNDSYFNMLGGLISAQGNLYAYDNAQIMFSSGAITNGGLFLYDSTDTIFTGGSIFAYLETYDSSKLTVSGGQMLDSLMVHDNSNVTMFSGTISDSLFAYHNTNVTVSGGTITNDIVAGVDSGSSYAVITLVGSDFAVNGQSVGYGELTSINRIGWNHEPWRHLTGTLANGDLIDNDFRIGYDAKIVLTPIPSTVILGTLGLTFSGWLLKRKRML